MKKQNKGVTLIALIITIIILLILVGVTIATLTGENGLLERARQAVEETKYANAEEKVKLAIVASYGTDGNIEDNLLKENINKIQGLEEKIDTISYDLTVKVDGYEFKISKLGEVTCVGRSKPTNTGAGGEVALEEGWKTETMRYVKTTDGEEVKEVTKVATVYAVSDGAGNKVPIPYEFYYVGGTVDSGVVISDKKADQNRYIGKPDVGKDLVGNQFVWIPCNINNYQKYDWGYTTTSIAYDSMTPIAEKTQIQKYGGFYVARYEAGASEIQANNGVKMVDALIQESQSANYSIENVTENSKPTSKAEEIPYGYVNYNTAYKMSERMYNTNYVNSGLITGTQWDVMLNYISNETDKSILNANNSNNYKDLKSECTWGNFANTTLTNCSGKYCTYNKGGQTIVNWTENVNKTNAYDGNRALLTTGSTEEGKKKNLYDVAGNLFEWTQDTTSGTSHEMRGGSYNWNSANMPVCNRDTCADGPCWNNYGFRVVLYMK